MASEKKLKYILHKYGLKITATRLKVLGVMEASEVALSHSDITSRIDDRTLDKVTLYRTLNAFTECGLAHKVANKDRNWLYALHILNDELSPGSDDHAHFVCDECERIYCLPLPPEIENAHPDVREKHGFVIRSQEYRLHGTCPECN